MKRLKEIVIDKGSDWVRWTPDERREACIELFESDVRGDWMSDAFSEALFREKDRNQLIEALKHDSPAMRFAALGLAIERILLTFPLDSLQRTAEEHEADWIRSAA